MTKRYSSKTRKLAARALGIMGDRTPEQRERDRSPRPPNKPPAQKKATLTAVPLDRKRGVSLSGMSDEELDRALEQARKRVNRTKPSADLNRYEGHVRAIETEVRNRGELAAREKVDLPQSPPPARVPPTDRPEPPAPEFSDDAEEGPPRLPVSKPIDSAPAPGDTPESPWPS
jgi:hypothetical protein